MTSAVVATNTSAMLSDAITSSTGTAESSHLKFWRMPFPARIRARSCSAGNSENITNFIAATPVESVIYVPDILAQAIETIGIGKQHIASIFGISRQHLYNIIKDPGTDVKPENQKRAADVAQALRVIRNITSYKLGSSVLTFRIDNVRLLDVLQQETIDLDRVERFAAEINSRIATTQPASSIPESIADQQEYLDKPSAA